MLIKNHQKGSSCGKLQTNVGLQCSIFNTSKMSEIFFFIQISYVNESKKYVIIILCFLHDSFTLLEYLYLGDSSYFSINRQISSENMQSLCSIMMIFNCCNRMIFSSTQIQTLNSIPYFQNIFQNIQILAAFLLSTNLCTYWLNNRRKSLYLKNDRTKIVYDLISCLN